MREQAAAQAPVPTVSIANAGGWKRPPGLRLVAPVRRAPQTLTRRSAVVAPVAAVLVAVGSLFNETWWESNTFSARRRKRQTAPRVVTHTAWTDDSWTWAFPTLVRGVSAFGLLAGASLLGQNHGGSGPWRRAIAVSLGIVAAVCLATASLIAGQYWRPLLVEQAAGGAVRSGVLMEGLARIAFGLPIVTVAGALGAVACLVFAFALLTHRVDMPRSPDEIPRSSE